MEILKARQKDFCNGLLADCSRAHTKKRIHIKVLAGVLASVEGTLSLSLLHGGGSARSSVDPDDPDKFHVFALPESCLTLYHFNNDEFSVGASSFGNQV